MTFFNKEYIWLMKIAFEQAEIAYKKGEVPVGALIVNKDGEILSSAHNNKEESYDPCGHAEIIAIREAGKKLSSWRLNECSLITTLEPCSMCAGSIIQARIKSLVFGAYDKKQGFLSIYPNIQNHKKLNHKFNIVGGILHYECSEILSTFFKSKREPYNYSKN